jgi:hypothetical protein
MANKTQGQIFDILRNRVANNSGTFITESELDYKGEKIVVYAILPQNLASTADEVLAEILPESYDPEEGVDEEEVVVEEPKAKKPAKKAATKKTAPKKAPVKKAKKK